MNWFGLTFDNNCQCYARRRRDFGPALTPECCYASRKALLPFSGEMGLELLAHAPLRDAHRYFREGRGL